MNHSTKVMVLKTRNNLHSQKDISFEIGSCPQTAIPEDVSKNPKVLLAELINILSWKIMLPSAC